MQGRRALLASFRSNRMLRARPAPAPPPSPSSWAPKAATASTGAAAPPPTPQTHREQRKWERVSLAGTKAHAILTDLGQRTARVIDLSYGGVALLLEKPEEIPNQFNAVLHVPILPPVRVILRKAYCATAGRRPCTSRLLLRFLNQLTAELPPTPRDRLLDLRDRA